MASSTILAARLVSPRREAGNDSTALLPVTRAAFAILLAALLLAVGPGPSLSAEPEFDSTVTRGERQANFEADPAVARVFQRLRKSGAFADGRDGRIDVSLGGNWKGIDADLALLTELPRLDSLSLELARVSPQAIGRLRFQQPLGKLTLIHLSDDHLAAIGHLPACGDLKLKQPSLSGQGYRQLAKSAGDIADLWLDSKPFNEATRPSSIDDEGLAAIGKIHSLKRLHIGLASITDDALASLAGLEHLESLSLRNCDAVRGSGYVGLADAAALRELTISEMPLSAEALQTISTLGQITGLALESCELPAAEITQADAAVLRDLADLKSLSFSADPAKESSVAAASALYAAAAKLQELRKLSISPVGDADNLAVLIQAPALEELTVDLQDLDDDVFDVLANLENLKSLSLHLKGPLKPETPARLAKLKSLTTLWIFPSGLDDNSLGQLADLVRLKQLQVCANGITGTPPSALAEFQELTRLELSAGPFSDAGAESLRGLKQLKTLALDRTKITDRALDVLATLPNLELVNLDQTKVTPAGVKKLRSLNRLRFVSIVGVEWTNAELDELREAMPDIVQFAMRITAAAAKRGFFPGN